MRERVSRRRSYRGDSLKIDIYELRRRGFSDSELSDMMLRQSGLIGRM